MKLIMEPNPLVSVILPTYNVEKYLEQCLDSVQKQSYKNIEVIVVIDGATDRSGEIATVFEKKDKRFHVYYQSNQGSGPARNHGLSKAHGEFIVFVDPDDWLDEKFIETLLEFQQTKDFDFVTSGSINITYQLNKKVKRTETELQEIHFTTQTSARENYWYLFENSLILAPTAKLYKMSLIKQYNIEFPDLRRSQDIVFNYRYFNIINSAGVCPYNGYYYRIISSQTRLKFKKDYYKTIILLYNDIQELCKQWNVLLNQEKVNTHFLKLVIVAVESNLLNKESYLPIIKNDTIQDILQKAYPRKTYHKLFRALALKNKLKLLNLLISFKYLLKRNILIF